MSPEIINNNGNLTEKSDIYSLGMVLLEMITVEIPYSDISDSKEIIKKVIYLNNFVWKITKGILPSSLDKIDDPQIKEFILKFLKKDPKDRLSIREILEDE